jgi:LuxR family maltose regulon positive regulatory protein
MPDTEFDSALIQTKLLRPILPVDLVPRPQLTEWLDARRQRPVTLVSAPAGYGKSTLISNWLDHCNYPSTWLTLDVGDNDLSGFLTYFLAAVREIYPEAAKKILSLISSGSKAPTWELANGLANDINQIDEYFVLVLDDYESIQNPQIHDFIDLFLLHPPQDFHLVICSRIDPPLSILKLRAQSRLTEIRAHDLRFSIEESFTFLQNMLGSTIDIDTIKKLDQQSEGWVTGLRLAALTLRHRVGNTVATVAPAANNQYVLDYLMSEILDNQTQVFSDCMVKTSILTRFNAGLCEALCFVENNQTTQSNEDYSFDGDGFLKWLIGSNLFTVPLDDYHQWVRYHNLFRDFLRQELSHRYNPVEIAALHLKASQWFAQKGFVEEALDHALEAGDSVRAAQLIEQNTRKLLSEDKWYILENWLTRLPDEIIQGRPRLLIAKDWVYYYRFALAEIPPLLESIENIPVSDGSMQTWLGDIDFFWGQHWYWMGETSRALTSLNSAIAKIPLENQVARGEAELFWSLALQASGQIEKAVQGLNQWLYYQEAPNPVRAARLLGGLIFVYILSGELTSADQVGKQFLQASLESDNTYATAWSYYLLGNIHYCWGSLDNAAEYFSRAVENRYALHTRAAIDALAGLTLTYQAIGKSDKAKATIKLFLDFADETNYPAYKVIAHSCQARLALLMGDMVSAEYWLKTTAISSDSMLMFYWLEIPQITQCRVLLHQGSENNLHQAAEKLHKYWLLAMDQFNTRRMIDISILQALLNHKLGQSDQAVHDLERAIQLAKPGNYLQPFVESGAELEAVFAELMKQNGATDYIGRILQACKIPHDPEKRRTGYQPSTLIDPLTNRENEILELLGERLTNKEIAARLHISVGTVQQHLNHIYSKLDVSGRRLAIAKAIELNLIPNH